MACSIKKPFVVISAIVICLGLASWFTRQWIGVKLTQPYLTPYQLTLDCLEWSFNHNLDIAVEKLCLSHPLAEIEANELTVINPRQPQLINIKQLKITSLVPTTTWLGQQQQASTAVPFAPSQVLDQLNKLLAFELPSAIEIQQLDYHGYQQPQPLTANIKLGLHNQIRITEQNTSLLELSFSHDRNQLNGQLKVNLAATIHQLKQQQIPLPKPLQETDLQGELNSEFSYDKQKLSLSHQLNIQKLTKPLTLQGVHQLAWHNELSDEYLKLQTKTQPQAIQLRSPQSQLEQWLKPLNLNASHKAQIKANPPQGLTITLPPHSQLHWQAQQLNLSAVHLDTHNKTLPISLSANKVQLIFADQSFSSDFNIKSTSNIIPLQPYSQRPVELSIKGRYSKTPTEQQLVFASAEAKVTDLSIPSHAKITAEQADIYWQGQLTFANNKITTELELNSTITQLQAQKIAGSQQMDINLDINGHNQDINMAASFYANQLLIGQLKLAGPINQPNIELQAQQLPIAELFSLNLNPKIKLKPVDGQLNYTIKGQLNPGKKWLENDFDIHWQLSDLSTEIKQTWLQGLSLEQDWQLSQGKLTTKQPQPLKLALIEAGTQITNLQGQLAMTLDLNSPDIQSTFRLNMENLSGEAFSGQFELPNFNWPIQTDTMTLELQGLDLSRIVAMEKQQGIIVTGLISGQLPTTVKHSEEGFKVTINNGSLHNISDGVISIKDNPAVVRLKQSREDLKLAFDALQNLHYHLLTSAVTMTDDGQMLLETVIKGVNPDLDNEVNFNLNLDYDLLGLLRSALMSQTLEQQINQTIEGK